MVNYSELKKDHIKIPQISSAKINEEIIPVLHAMEKSGIELDVEFFHQLETKIVQKISELEKQIYVFAGEQFNLNSPSQLADFLFFKLKLSTAGVKKTQSGFSTAASELKKIENEHKIIPLILEYRELSKLLSTYLKPLPTLVDSNNRLHTTYGLETTTGRITSSEPNLQNIPIRGQYGNEIRRAFVAAKGCKLVVADYSQIELRVVASLAGDEAMIKSFQNDEDIHTRTAAEIFHIEPKKVTSDQRRKAKAVNFGIVYGQTPYGLSQALSISVEEADKYIKKYFEIHTGIWKYINETIAQAHHDGFVETLFGTRRYLPNLNSPTRYIAEAEERMAINTPVQGTAAEILKLAMIELNDKLTANKKNLSRLLLNVHDELVVEVPADQTKEIADLVKKTMENVVSLPVPIIAHVGIGQNWAEAK